MERPTTDTEIKTILRSIRPVLQRANLDEEQRAHLVYDLVHEVYDYVKFDVYGPTVDAPERTRIGEMLTPPSHPLASNYYRRLLVGGPVGLMYSDQVHSTASRR
ncbi:hypothetical protein CW368_11885 [Actinomycetales bacterium SN12]|nr:hypothetical protein CW368_11885 [Actinomycetales bacterium SN12]